MALGELRSFYAFPQLVGNIGWDQVVEHGVAFHLPLFALRRFHRQSPYEDRYRREKIVHLHAIHEDRRNLLGPPGLHFHGAPQCVVYLVNKPRHTHGKIVGKPDLSHHVAEIYEPKRTHDFRPYPTGHVVERHVHAAGHPPYDHVF